MIVARLPRRGIIACLAALAIAPSGAPTFAQAQPILVFAAASLKNVLDLIEARWRAETGKHATISYAASSTLAKQIENGAPADLFISADDDWMDYLQQRKRIDPRTRVELLGNTLVLIAPANTASETKISPGFPLAQLLDSGRLALADPSAVPAGRYAKAALTKLGVWDSVAGRIAAAENVRAALLLVARGEAPLGVVYRTDAAAEPGVRVIATFPPDTHPPIIYPMALTPAARADAAAFAGFLRTPAARALFQAQGFAVLDHPE